MLFGQLGEYEIVIILAAVGFLIIGVPTLGALAAKLGTGVGFRIKRWFCSLRG